ncbi:branched-chain amino acid ABC transporter substrate-binding protein [Chryseobacterium pennipullorum]|uniref:Branched-chain amino acid ABC transporter substrate-binding protein n=1 Tax=Chryseobacterium pennipullorum TaxID=2258963 RepID=A0A3D9B334_9FLAO|nr:branched-chain amino acid ABC transporter substrate-binding protein [Chryseobacterium pennipullorum]
MSWDFLGIFEVISDAMNLLSSGSSLPGNESLNHNEIHQKKRSQKSKYFTAKVSAGSTLVSGILCFIVFRDPLPEEHYMQTLIVISLIGIAISFILFFVLYILKCFYFKNLFKLLIFSVSTIVMVISIVLFIYFRSGLFM